MKRFGILLQFVVALALGCKKEEAMEQPSIKSFRTYAMNPFQVERAPQGGYVMQCIEGSIAVNASPRAGFAQFIDRDGELGARIDYRTLPTTIQDLEFLPDDIWITDIIPQGNGQNTLIGIASVLVEPFVTKLYLLIYKVDANGVEVSPPFYRLLSDNASVVYDTERERDPTPITRAYGIIEQNGDLLVAVTLHQGPPVGATDVVVMRIPMAGSSQGEASVTFTTPDQPTVALWSFQPFGGDDHVLLVIDGGGPEAALILRELDPGEGSIGLVSQSTLEPDEGSLLPFFIQGSDEEILVGGSTLPFDVGGQGGSFITHATSLAEAELIASFRTFQEGGTSSLPSQSFAGTLWNGELAMMTSLYQRGTRAPYQYYDTKCDLQLRLVSPETGAVTLDRKLVSGQGLRGLGLFHDNGRLICIGARNAYNNVSVPHAFFMELNDPRLGTN